MIYYLDTSALLKFVKSEKESETLTEWRQELGDEVELLTSELSELELTRSLQRAGTDTTQVPYFVRKALDGIFLSFLDRSARLLAISYEIRQLGSLDAIHLATADRVRNHLSALVTYDRELADAAKELGLPVSAPA